MKKRFFSFLLAVCLLTSLLPVGVLADDEAEPTPDPTAVPTAAPTP